jgi:hypothetical protein
MRGTVSGFLFFTRTRYRVFILRYRYPMRPFSLCIYKGNERMGIRKIKKRGIRGSENKGNGGKGYPSGTHAGLSLLSQSDLSCFTSFMLVFSSWMPIQSWSCHSIRLSLFSLRGSRLGLLFFRLPPFPPASPTRSVSIQLFVTDCGNGASR